MNEILKEESRALARDLRFLYELTQDEMAERLHMATRSYADIESGESACGQLTLMLLLQMLRDEDRLAFVDRVNGRFSALLEQEVSLV
jgi:transcriptional regulator with XRE-family HTH domain